MSAGATPIAKTLPPACLVRHGRNAEMRWDAAADLGPLVPSERFFVRNHSATPHIDADRWRLEVHGDGLRGSPTAAEPVRFGYEDLLAMPSVEVTAALECTGNGRRFFGTQQGTPAPGTQWGLGAIGVARWRGVPLAELLDRAGLHAQAVDVMPAGLDAPYVTGGIDHGRVRRPLPIGKALDDVLVAYAMNGEPLPPDHGFPARLLVPGWVGVASIKWLGSLHVSRSPLSSPWNTVFYRMRGGEYPPDSPPLTTQPVRSAFELGFHAVIPARRPTVLRGRSWSGAAAIARVDVSVDGARSWRPARRLSGDALAWTRWELEWTPPEPGRYELLARATDEHGTSQPDTVPFNAGGYQFWAVVRHPVVAHAA